MGNQLGQAAMGIGTGAVSGLLGAGMGLMLQGGQDRRQLRQQQKLQNLEIQGNKQMVDYNMNKQLQMWKDTSYSAQREQMEKAGLNPALMYGIGGGGGQTTGQSTGTVKGGDAPKGGGEAMGAMGIMSNAQLALMNAQKENIEADTKNKLADVPVKGATVPNIEANTENTKAQTKLTNLHQEIAQVAASVSRQTINEQMKAWENIVAKGTAEIANMKADTTKKEQELKNLKSEVALNTIKGALMNAQKENTNQDTKNKIQEVLESEQRIKSMAQQLMVMWDKWEMESGLGQQELFDKMNEDKDWDFIKGALPTFLMPIGKNFGGGGTPIRGFHNR